MRTIRLLAAILTIPTTLASAQEIENLAGLRLNFDRADTRAMSMGATGIAAKSGDAVMNPASIAGAERSMSIDVSRQTIESRYINDTSLGTIGLRSTTGGLRSASLTLPLAGLTWSFFYDQPLDVKRSTAAVFANAQESPFYVCEGRVSAVPCPGPIVLFHLPATYPIDASINLQRYGAAAAWSRGPLALGASLRREHLSQKAVFTGSPYPYAYAYPGGETTDDSALTWGAGMTLDLGSKARFGASYSSGGAFSSTQTFSVTPTRPSEVHTPPSAGIGLSFDPIPQVILAADVVRVQYSSMMHDRRNIFLEDSTVGYPNVTELHAGAEYRRGPLALRAGWWRDPAHALSLLSGPDLPSPIQYAEAIVDTDEDHITAGIGYGTKTRLDASIDRAPRSTHLSLGVSTRF